MDDRWTLSLALLCAIGVTVCYCQADQAAILSGQILDVSLDDNCTNCHGNCSNSTGLCNGTCTDGFYGDRCDVNCSSNCRYGCNKTSGQCVYCAKHFYGDFCNKSCPVNCYSGCRQDGSCFGCAASWFGDRCDKQCPANCSHNGCDAPTGYCVYGCADFHWGTESCNETCPENCHGQCMQDTGLCYTCKSGHLGNRCDKVCVDPNCSKCTEQFDGKQNCYECTSGFYGRHCDLKCPQHCKNSECQQLTATCICASGWYGENCTMECFGNCSFCVDNSTCATCVDGFYGDRCEQHCPSDCPTCSRNGKKCTGYCQEWNEMYGPHCECRRSECDARLVPHSFNCSSCKNDSWYTSGEGCCPCSAHCNGTCDVTNGTCLNGCLGDYIGPKCDKECSSHCNGTCDLHTGMCEDGCQTDWYAPGCDVQCSVTFPHCNKCKDFPVKAGFVNDVYCEGCSEGYRRGHGNNCLPCDHCLHGHCNTTSGVCLDGCVEGYHYTYDFLHTCDATCHVNCVDRKCDNTDGNCTVGCVPGFYTDKCSVGCSAYCGGDRSCTRDRGICSRCMDGMYGKYCFFSCSSHCLNSTCGRGSGACSECEPGYYDDRCYSECDGCLDRTCTQTRACDTGCLPNRQGKYCEQTCSDHCFVCDQNSGACLLCDTGYGGVGCNMSSPHWFNPYDNTTIPLNGSCADGRFGATCGGVCDNCLEQHGKHRCEKFTGSCLYGCSSPFYGNRCDKICKSCKPEMGKNRTCDVITGECPNGCTSGYYGVLCNMTCGTNCLNKLCNQNNGTCTSGCAAGWQGDNCSIAKPEKQDDSTLSSGAIVGIVLGANIGVALIAGVIYFVYRRRKLAANNYRGINLNSR